MLWLDLRIMLASRWVSYVSNESCLKPFNLLVGGLRTRDHQHIRSAPVRPKQARSLFYFAKEALRLQLLDVPCLPWPVKYCTRNIY